MAENTKKDGVSVLISVYAKEKSDYFKAAMDSILQQTLMPDEIVLIEDGELPEELCGLLDFYQKKYPHLVRYHFEENVQLGRALRKGVELCSYELIARMDTDDIAVPERLEHQRDFMRCHPEITVCGGWMEEFSDDADGRQVKKMPEHSGEIKTYARKRNPFNHMTVMFRKSAVLDAGNYEHFPLLEDYHLWSRMLVKGNQMYNLPEVLVFARTNEAVYARRGGWKYMMRYLKFRKMQKEWGLFDTAGYVKAVILTVGITIVPAGARKFIYKKILRR